LTLVERKKKRKEANEIDRIREIVEAENGALGNLLGFVDINRLRALG
jgi:hypothetical protein